MGIISLSANSRARLNAIGLASSTGPGILPLADTIMALSPGAYWKLDEASGTFADSSGNGLTGTGTGVTYQGKAGPDGDYVDLNSATNTRITISDNALLSVGSGMTMFCLLHPDVLGNSWAIATKGIAPGYTTCEWAVSMNAAGAISHNTMQANGTAVKTNSTPSSTLVTGSWQAFAFTWSSEATSALLESYKNSGTPLADGQITGSGSGGDRAGVLTLGNRIDLTSYEFDGGMAHTAIFNSVLSDAEIQDLMDAAAADGWI